MDLQDNTDSVTEKFIISTKKTQDYIEKLEKDVKETIKFAVFNEWDQENTEIIEQFEDFITKTRCLKAEMIRKDVEIFRLREILADKRKSLKQSRVSLDSLRSLISKAEESLFQRDLVICDQSEKIAGILGNPPAEPFKKRVQKPLESCKSNKFLPTNSSNQGIYLTKPIHKLEDRGKQEINMPFLSFSAQNWISSLRTPTKSPIRRA